MGRKNLLSDTDYTSGHDNRYGATVLMGFVSKIECTDKRSSVRVILPDRLDHQDNPVITKPVPVLQVASAAKKSFCVPRLGDTVALMKMPNSTSDYFVIGSFYTPRNPPPVSDPMLDHTTYDDGSIMEFNASNGTLTWKLKGDVLWTNEKGATLKFKEAVTIETDGDVNIKPVGGSVNIEAGGLISLKGTMKFEGNIDHTGNMVTHGTHTDNLGHHTSSQRDERIDQLEKRVARLERIIETLTGGQQL
jgi:phage baseplate assembly protein V